MFIFALVFCTYSANPTTNVCTFDGVNITASKQECETVAAKFNVNGGRGKNSAGLDQEYKCTSRHVEIWR